MADAFEQCSRHSKLITINNHSSTFMKKFLSIAVGLLLAGNLLAADTTTTAADQKWLSAAQKLVKTGRTISTPSQVRLALVKEWAKKEGFTVAVTKTETSYQVQASRSLASN